MEDLSLTPINQPDTPWLVRLQPEKILFTPPPGKGETFEIPHGQRVERLELVRLLGKQSVLLVWLDEAKKTKYQFKLSPAERQRLERWFGPPTREQLKIALKRRYAFALPIAVIFILTALPIPANPDEGIEAVPARPFSIGLGAGLLILWTLARVRPHPLLFLLDSIWFVLLGGKLVVDVFQGGAAPIWLLWIGLIIPIVLSGLNNYKSFAGYKEPLASSSSP